MNEYPIFLNHDKNKCIGFLSLNSDFEFDPKLYEFTAGWIVNPNTLQVKLIEVGVVPKCA